MIWVGLALLCLLGWYLWRRRLTKPGLNRFVVVEGTKTAYLGESGSHARQVYERAIPPAELWDRGVCRGRK